MSALSACLRVREPELEGALRLKRPDAGMHAVGILPPGIDDRAIVASAQAGGVSSLPLSSCYAGPNAISGPLLGYAAFDARQIRSGIQKLSVALARKPPAVQSNSPH